MEEHGIKQMSDDSALLDIIVKILDESPSQIEAYKAGKTNLIGYFVGQVMKETKGTANPGMVNKLLNKEIAKR
jgi:aspartyl-tRNA(Asn)/glutamyl-tRNA(Gln) amidotransferase subunit B